MSMSKTREADGSSATIAIDMCDLYHVISLTFALNQNIHTIVHSPIQIKAFPTDFPSFTLETSPNTSSANAMATPSLLLRGTKSMIPHRMSSTPTSSRSVLGFMEEALRSWIICSGVICELSLATPAESTVKDRVRAERKERIEAKDMMK